MEADFAAVGHRSGVHRDLIERRHPDVERSAAFERDLRCDVDRPVEEVLAAADRLALRNHEMRLVGRSRRIPDGIVVRPVGRSRSRGAPTEREAERTVDRLVEREGEERIVLVLAAGPRLHRQVVVAAVLVPVAEAQVIARGAQLGRDVGARAVHRRRRNAVDRPRAVRTGIIDVLAVAVGRRAGHDRQHVGKRDAAVEAGRIHRREIRRRARHHDAVPVVHARNAAQPAAADRHGVDAERAVLPRIERETLVVGRLDGDVIAQHLVQVADHHLCVERHVHRLVIARRELGIGHRQRRGRHLRGFRTHHPVVRNGLQLHHAGFGVHAHHGAFQVDLQLFARIAVKRFISAQRDAAAGFQVTLQRKAVIEVVVVLNARHDDAAEFHLLRHGVVAVGGQRPQVGNAQIAVGRSGSLHEIQLLGHRSIAPGRDAQRERTARGSRIFTDRHRHRRRARRFGARELRPRRVVARDGYLPVAVGPDLERERRAE